MTIEQSKSELMKIYGALSPNKQIAIDTLIKASVKQEPKTGHWIEQTLSVKPFGEDTVLCDQCAFLTDRDNTYNYCPNCGAKMIEQQESERINVRYRISD